MVEARAQHDGHPAAEDRRAVVADRFAGEAGQDRREVGSHDRYVTFQRCRGVAAVREPAHRAHRPGAARTRRSRAVQPGGHGRNYLRDASGRLSQPGRNCATRFARRSRAKSRLRRPRRRSNKDGALYEAVTAPGSRARRTLFRDTDAVAERLSSRQCAAWTASWTRPSCSLPCATSSLYHSCFSFSQY